MRSARYHFHCTDGCDAVFDRSGRIVPGEARLRAAAEKVARAPMRACGPAVDWSAWIVDVHDAAGCRSMTLPFSDLRSEARSERHAA